MSDKVVLCDIDSRGVATVTINRPEVNNAYNGDVITGLLNTLKSLEKENTVRVIILRGNGGHFQAGADLKWINEVAGRSEKDNILVSKNTTDVIRFLDYCRIPTVALVQGGCFGGGTGIIAACDIVIASKDAFFSISEVRWGLHAGPILPQLAAAMGTRNLRRYALTGERFGAEKACNLGLIHEICPEGGLDLAASPVIESILRNGPKAISDTKRIIFEVMDLEIDDMLARALATDHARKRRTKEATEGLASFAEKREANWYPEK